MTLAEWLVVGALAALGLLAGANAAQAQSSGTNATGGSAGASGPVGVGNIGVATGGPGSGGLFGVSAASMNGDTNTTIDQNTRGESGPATAGSQVAKPGPGTSTHDTNVSAGSLAVSAPVLASSVAASHAGPSASSGLGVAAASQSGDVNVVVRQDTEGRSGPATAGSQIATGGVGDAVTSDLNVSAGALALSGPVVATNLLGAQTGPSSTAFLGGVATSSQVGRDDAFLTQGVSGASGGAVAGSQVTTDPSGRVHNTNATAANAAASGPVQAGNALASIAGASSSALGPGSTASSSHNGDTSVVGTQNVGSSTGDAVVGSQLTGPASGERGVLEVPNQQASEPDFQGLNSNDPLAALLKPLGINLPSALDLGGLLGLLGGLGAGGAIPGLPTGSIPGLPGAGSIPGLPTGITGETVSNTNVTGANLGFTGGTSANNAGLAAAGPSSHATAAVGLIPALVPGVGDSTAASFMDGKASANLDQGAKSGTGNSVAGSQVAGVTPAGNGVLADVNGSVANLAGSGPTAALNAGVADSGPAADAITVGALPIKGSLATAGQNGNTDADLTQRVGAGSGDATSGSQVENGVSGLTFNKNFTAFGAAVSGPGGSANVGRSHAGAGSLAGLIAVIPPPGNALTGDAVAGSFQNGDDSSRLLQGAQSLSGDASTGSQIDRGLGIGLGLMDNLNVSGFLVSATGGVGALNLGQQAAGPVAEAATLGGGAIATVGQDGKDTVNGSQGALALSGDAAAGSQGTKGDIGLVSHSKNVSALAAALSGSAGDANLGSWLAGPIAAANDVSVPTAGFSLLPGAIAATGQKGDDQADWSQFSGALTGDSLAGSQGDAVGLAGALADTNVSLGSFSHSGNAADLAAMGGVTGPVAAAIGVGPSDPFGLTGHAAAFSTQNGGDQSIATQAGNALTGDAIAGSQLRNGGPIGLASAGAALNLAAGSISGSGDSFGAQELGAVSGPVSIAVPLGALSAVAAANQSGTDRLISGQVGVSASGDAASGSQVFGQLGGIGGLGRVNATAGSISLTGPAFGNNLGIGAAVPTVSFGGIAAGGQGGDNLLLVLQHFGSFSGDVLIGTQTDIPSLLPFFFGTNLVAPWGAGGVFSPGLLPRTSVAGVTDGILALVGDALTA